MAPSTTPTPDTLSISDVRRLVLAQSPELRAARRDTAIARGEVRQARLIRLNPDVSVVAPGAGAAGNRNATEFVVQKEFELAGQRGLRIDAASRGFERAAGRVSNATRMSLTEASLTFYRALAAQRRLSVAREVLRLTDQLLGAVRTQLAEGEISVLEANLAEIEFGRARARVLAAQREATGASVDLSRILGIAISTSRLLFDSTATADETLTSVVDTTTPNAVTSRIDSLTTLAMSRRGDIDAANAEIRELQALIALSRREALPNLRLGLLAERNHPESRVRVGPVVGVTLPLFNRAQGTIDQRRAALRRSFELRDAVRLQVRADIEEASYAVDASRAEVAALAASVRGPARRSSELLETAFRAGKTALPTLLLLRNQLIDSELAYWAAWQAYQEALTRLDAATGAISSTPDVRGATPREGAR